ncbi:MAG: sugar ABC transporter permease [Candidatus Sericytochromatia bacterium]|nr:sugar ABC transporter permease [Candidatus Sericytochromatia bacterium]
MKSGLVEALKNPTSRLAYLYIAPAAVVMGAITFYPMLYGIWMAFTNFGPVHIRKQNPDFVGFDNFIALMTNAPYLDVDFFRVLAFTIVWTVSNVVLHVVIGVALALLLNREGMRGKRLYRALLILPWAVPVYVTALVWRNMFDTQSGALNLLLQGWGWSGIDWMSAFPSAFSAVLLTNVWLGFPFMMMVASGGLQSIPKDYYEAASLDGASAWRQFWTITVPMLRPTMVPAIVLGSVWTFNNFNVIYFVSRGEPFGRTEILVTQAYKLIDPLGMYGVASAFSILIFLILFGLTQLNLRLARSLEDV